MPDLYEITGLPRDVDASRLRYVYEQHVADAARAQQHRRLLELSRAFDALPRPVRLAMYPSTAVNARRLPATTVIAARPAHRRRHKPARRQKRARNSCSPWNQPLSGKTVAVLLLLVGGLAAIKFATALHQHNTVTLPRQHAAPGVTPVDPVDPVTVADDLNRSNHRDDITCARTPAAGVIGCRASDGAQWTVTVDAYGHYSTVESRPSVYLQSAQWDLQQTEQMVDYCRSRTGRLPATAESQTGQARLPCGAGTVTWYLHPGNRVDYLRLSRNAYAITVTASNGEVASYSSR